MFCQDTSRVMLCPGWCSLFIGPLPLSYLRTSNREISSAPSSFEASASPTRFQTERQPVSSHTTFTMAKISGIVAFIIIVLIVVILVALAWLIFANLRARRLGLPQPSISSYNPFGGGSQRYGGGPAQGGIIGRVKGMFSKGNNRSAGGAYEEPLSSNVRGRSNRGFGPLDPDEAWDARVGTEADAYGPGGYYEEQELGLHGGGHGAGAGLAAAPGAGQPGHGAERGRSLSREPELYIGGSQAGLDRRYDEEMGRKPAVNPFDDTAEPSIVSLRGVSPRPMDAETRKGHKKHDSMDDGERRSIFREDIR